MNSWRARIGVSTVPCSSPSNTNSLSRPSLTSLSQPGRSAAPFERHQVGVLSRQRQ